MATIPPCLNSNLTKALLIIWSLHRFPPLPSCFYPAGLVSLPLEDFFAHGKTIAQNNPPPAQTCLASQK